MVFRNRCRVTANRNNPYATPYVMVSKDIIRRAGIRVGDSVWNEQRVDEQGRICIILEKICQSDLEPEATHANTV